MGIKFKIIVKRSSINKLNDLIYKRKVLVFLINGEEYCIMQTDNYNDEDGFNTSIHIWPRCWGYDGYKDGHSMYIVNVTNDILLSYSEYLIDVLNKLKERSLIDLSVIEINENDTTSEDT